MIARIPSLEFLHSLCGSFVGAEGLVSLRICRCGYGVALDLTDGGKSTLCGVAGACGSGVECFIQFGLPNVTRTVGTLLNESTLSLAAEEPRIELRLSRQEGGLVATIALDGKAKVAYALVVA